MADDDRIIPFPGGSKTKRGCPICGKPGGGAYQPFCSERCQQVDLGRWLKGNYRIPTDEVPGEQEAWPDDES